MHLSASMSKEWSQWVQCNGEHVSCTSDTDLGHQVMEVTQIVHLLSQIWAHFTNTFSIIIQIRGKICTVIPPVGNQLLQTFCSCHDSCVVIPCAKFGIDHLIMEWMRTKLNFHAISMTMEELLVKWASILAPIIDAWDPLHQGHTSL